MLRSIWQGIKDIIYDTVGSVFRTQEEIDDIVDVDFEEKGFTLHDDVSTVPQEATRRNREFLFSDDVIKYVSDAGIPPSCVHVVKHPEYDEYGNTIYKVWIEPNTP